MAKYYSGITTGTTLDSMLASGSEFGIFPSQDIDCGNITVTGSEGTDAIIQLLADDGDDNEDKWRIRSDATGNDLKFESYYSGSWSDGSPLKLAGNGIVTIPGQAIIDKVNINDNIVQTNTATDELIVRGKGVGGSHHLKLDDHVTIVGNVTPDADDSQDLGSSTKRWRNIFTGDLQLSNVTSPSNTDESVGIGNEVDGTQGTWTIQEGTNDLFLINRINGKKYKFNLTEIS